MDVIVVGSGVSGLTTAVVLAEGGHRVRVWTGEPAARTTSAVAGALWEPYLVQPRALVADWSALTYRALRALAEEADPARTGVRMADGVNAQRTAPMARPWWASLLPDALVPAAAGELPAGYAAGLRARLPLVDMPVYLAYLTARLEEAGGSVAHRPVAALAEAAAAAPRVVNCTGLGARALVPDPDLAPVQGQIVVVDNPGLTDWFVDEGGDADGDEGRGGLVYLFPHRGRVVLGGTARPGRWGTEPDPRTTAAILERCAAVEPRLAGARVQHAAVGLRPHRPQVRLEAEELAGGAVCVHNYGHGGAGITVSWGCAARAAALLTGRP